uniref:Ras association domain family member 6 n=1 Tax=Hucho hucho TaxID=62062 RepID=A0A4W5K724_9TELE
MRCAVLTTLWRALRLWAEQLPYQAVIQPDRMLSIVHLYDSSTLRPTPTKQKTEVEEEQSTLIRCMSDASLVKRRVKKSPSHRERNRQHCFSINGHFYNYKTAIFTPSYGTSTNVRINSKMTTHQVISQLLQKFKIENDPNEFALYCVHQSGEKKKLSDSDMPLWERLLRGPAENIMKMFLMDRDEEEVSNDVAQYLNLELPILEGVLVKLEEEENRELQRITTKLYQHPPGYSRKYIHYIDYISTHQAIVVSTFII